MWQAINRAIHDEMREREEVVILGQDVAAPGGPYGLTRGLLEMFGPNRVRDTPISEAAITAAGIGAAMMGLRPIVEVMFFDFIGLAIDQIVNQAAKLRFYLPEAQMPLVIQTLYGGRASMGPQHSQSLESWFCHVPGLKVAFPSTPQDAYDVLRLAVADDDPVIVVHSIANLRTRGELDTPTPRSPMHEVGLSRLVESGEDVTVVSYGPALAICEEALHYTDASVELIDLRWLQPWDAVAVGDSVARTSRLLIVHDAVRPGGWGAEIAAQTLEEHFWDMDVPPLRIAGDFSAVPVQSRDWESQLPTPAEVGAAIEKLLAT